MAPSSVKGLEKLLDYTASNQKVINKNIANVATVGYQREELRFDEMLTQNLKSGMKVTDSKHISPASPENGYQVEKDSSGENISGSNNVDINKEMADLAENQLMFKFASRKIAMHFRKMQSVIKGGR